MLSPDTDRQSTSLSITITSSSSTPKSGVGLRSRRGGFLLERCGKRGIVAPPAPNVRIPAPFVEREPKLRPCPVPHLTPSDWLPCVSSVALLLPLPVPCVEVLATRPLREFPPPTKAPEGSMGVSYQKWGNLRDAYL